MQNQENSPVNQEANKAKQESNTSTPATSSQNSGESQVQSGEEVVNEQEQNKSVNQEEFIDDASANTKKANESDGDTLPVG